MFWADLDTVCDHILICWLQIPKADASSDSSKTESKKIEVGL